MFENWNNSHLKRQSINRCESQDVCSRHWINDLIGSKKEKFVEIVNSCANCVDCGHHSQTHSDIKSETFAKSYVKPELTSSELNISYISSKSGSTSIGSTSTTTSSITSTTTSSATSTSPSNTLANAGTQALNECQSCHSCPHLQRDLSSQCDRESGFDIKSDSKGKAVHLHHSARSRVNVPIVRSVSSSVITGRSFNGCGSHSLVNTCVDCCSQRFQSVSISEFSSNDSTLETNKCLDNTNAVHQNSCTSGVSDYNEEQIIPGLIPGLVAQRKIEILQRQVSDSSFFTHSCIVCGNTYALNNEKIANNLVINKMICEKNKDKSDVNDKNFNEKNGHHYEEIMDYKRSSFVNTCEKHCQLVFGVESEARDDEYELKYGPGIVDKLKHKFMSISVQQQSKQLSNYKLKRCSSLENILVDCRHNQSQQYLSRSKPSQISQATDLGKNGRNGALSVRSITDGGNRSNGSQQLSHRLYIQHHNNKNLYNTNSKSSAIVPLIKRAKSMETLLLQDDRERGRQPISPQINNTLLSKRETPLSNQKIDLQLNDSVLICDKTDSHSHDINSNDTLNSETQTQTTTKMKSVSQRSNGINDEMPKPDTVKTYKRIFEPTTGPKTVPETNGKPVVNNMNNKSKNNNYKRSPLNGSASAVNVKRKPPVVRATNKSVSLKTQTSVNSSSQSAISCESPLPQVIETIPSPSPTIRTSIPSLVEQNDKNNNSNDLNKSANSANNTSNSTSVRKPPIAPKRASLTLRANPLTGMSAAINKNNKINGSFNNTNASKKVHKLSNNSSISADNKPIEKTLKSKANDSVISKIPSVPLNGKKESPNLSSNTNNTHINGKNGSLDCCESPTNKSKVIKPIANIKPFTQNNQMNGNSKSESTPNDCQSVDSEQNNTDLGHNKTNETSIADKSVLQLDKELDTNNKLINNNNNYKSNKSDNETNGNLLESPLISNVNCNTNANKESNDENSCVVVNDENVSPNTCDIVVDKTRVNDPHSPLPNEPRVEDTSMLSQQTIDVLKPSLLLNSEANHPSKTANSSLWSQQKKTTNSSSTTIVFDFRGKDVKSNLAIHPLPFGVTAPKRQNGSSNGTVNDSDDDDNYSGSTDIPLPSGIIFLGENVRVGKGSLLLTRNKRLTIQFNDSAVETFEYPSEAFISTESVNSEVNSSVISDSGSRLTSLSQGRLGSYKPSLVDTTFELGVSRVDNSNNKKTIDLNNDHDESDAVKPANPDETSSWSTSSTASDLLF